MLKYHKEKNADATIAVMNVPIDEASSYGIMNTNEDLSIFEFEEKPKEPKSTKASMGIYIFTWEKLRKYLIEDEEKAKTPPTILAKTSYLQCLMTIRGCLPIRLRDIGKTLVQSIISGKQIWIF